MGATACFYGAGITTMTPGGGEPTIARTPAIQGTLYGFFGLEDPLIPNDQVDEIEAALQQHGKTHQIFRYANAGHGFCCDRRADYRPEACQDAWDKVQQLFKKLLT
jgi:carboxymethylenebutenolidase